MIEAPWSGSNSWTSSSITKHVEAVASRSWGSWVTRTTAPPSLAWAAMRSPRATRIRGSSRCSGSSRIRSDDGRISPAASSSRRRCPEERASGMACDLPRSPKKSSSSSTRASGFSNEWPRAMRRRCSRTVRDGKKRSSSKHCGNLPAEGNGVRVDEEAVDFHVAGQGRLPTRESAGYRGLPGAVDTHDSQDLTRVHGCRNFPAHRSPGVSHQQAFGFQNCPHAATLPAGLARPCLSV